MIQARGGFVSGVEDFDPKFFNISPKEAACVDPQHRLLLECAWQALESANIDPTGLRDGDGGVYVGIGQFDFGIVVEGLDLADLEANLGPGTAHSAACGRLSYFLGWRGPCICVDTACSASLVALHLAVQGLRRRECSIALCGGVNVIAHPRNHIIFSQANMLSPDGRCKTFDDSADGYVRSEGCAMLALKRVSDAQARRRSHPRARARLLRRQDGESGGLTVPNGTAQIALMREALASADARAGRHPVRRGARHRHAARRPDRDGRHRRGVLGVAQRRGADRGRFREDQHRPHGSGRRRRRAGEGRAAAPGGRDLSTHPPRHPLAPHSLGSLPGQGADRGGAVAGAAAPRAGQFLRLRRHDRDASCSSRRRP